MRPGNYEIVLGETTLRELVFEHAGGVRDGRACQGDLGRRLLGATCSASSTWTPRWTTSR